MENLKKIFSLYGFNQPNIEQIFSKLLQMSIRFHHPEITEEEIATKLSDPDIIQTLNYIVYITQQYFFARLDERWNQLIPLWIEKNKDEIFSYCIETRICDPIYPRSIEFDAVAVFGANKSEIFRRYRFLLSLLKHGKIKVKNSIYLLTGHRILTPRIDGSENYLKYLTEKYDCTLFETQLMLDLYEKLNFERFFNKNIKLHVIDTREINGRRPNTLDTLEEMIQYIDKADKKLLFISRSPVILEQKSAVAKVFDNSDFEYEVVGANCNLGEVNDKARASYHILMSIAGALYENYMNVATKLCGGRLYKTEELTAFKNSLGFRNAQVKEVIFSNKLLTGRV